MQTTQARALAHYTQLASQAACWASQAANEAAAAADAADAATADAAADCAGWWCEAQEPG